MAALIRPLTPEDAPAFAVVRARALIEVPHAFTNNPGEDRPIAETARSLEGEGYAVFGAFDEGQLVGIAGLIREPRIKLAHIARAVETARAWPGLTRVRLSVSAEATAARRVYESLGFVAWGVEPDALRTGGRSFDEVYLSLALARA